MTGPAELQDWPTYRSDRWPHTANPHLLVSKVSALRHGPVSHAWILNLRCLPATLERLRIDRQLEEALASGGDPLHLANMFGVSEGTAIRYGQRPRAPADATPATAMTASPR